MKTYLFIRCILYYMYLSYIITGGHTDSQLKTSNYCTRTEVVLETKKVPYTYLKKIPYEEFCLTFSLHCTKFKHEVITDYKILSFNKSRTVIDCCSGFKKENESCVPICSPECVHGECIEPNFCTCDEGWQGPLCAEACPIDRFGIGCQENCSCLNGGICDSKNGSCYCGAGYTGRYCEIPCPQSTYGIKCEDVCKCENDALCNAQDGSCICQPGYTGQFCEKSCDEGTHGDQCSYDCVCMDATTEYCHHVDGTCHCRPGYKGKYCEEDCDNSTFGIHCEETCQCDNGALCHHVTGECLCTAGWTGSKCTDECPAGTFGEGCVNKCLPCPDEVEICDPIDGNCSCPKTLTGIAREIICNQRNLNPNCTEHFVCKNGICDEASGKCECSPGWSGLDCSEDCPDGTYGVNCTEICNCTYCDRISGICLLKPDENADAKSAGLHPSKTNDIIWTIVVLLVIITFCVVAYRIYCSKRKQFIKDIRCNQMNTMDPENTASIEELPEGSFSNPVYVLPEFMNNMDPTRNIELDMSKGVARVPFKKNSLQDDSNTNVHRVSKRSSRNSGSFKESNKETFSIGDTSDEPEELIEMKMEEIYDVLNFTPKENCEKLENNEKNVE